MNKFNLKNFIFLSLVLVFLLIPNLVGAQVLAFLGEVFTIGNFASGVIGGILNLVAYTIGFLGGLLFALAGYLTDLALQLNFDVADLSKNAAVRIGWALVRDITNLGFVLVIIVIALATTLRFKEYGVKELLPKLIAAAILVNFSLTIASAFIDFSNVLSYTFASKISRDPRTMSTTIGGAFGVHRFLATSPEEATAAQSTAQFTTAALTGTATIAFSAVFTIIAALVFLAIGLLLLVRYVYLSILLIIMPIIFLFWVFPGLQSQWTKWWHKFIQWVFFAPIMFFFLYLTLATAAGLSKTIGDLGTENIGEGTGKVFAGLGAGLQTVMANAGQMIVLISLLVGGLIAADKMGIAGAKGMISLAQTQGKNFRGWAGKKAASTARSTRDRAITAGTDEKGTTGLERFGTRAAKTMQKLPLVGKTLSKLPLGLVGVSSGAKQRMQKSAEEYQSKYKDEPKASTLVRAHGITAATSPAESVGIANAAVENGLWDDINETTQKKMINDINSLGGSSREKFLSYKPSYAEDLGMSSIEEAMTKYVKDATLLSPKELRNSKVSGNLKGSHIKHLSNNGTIDQKTTVIATLEKDIGKENIENINKQRKALDQQLKILEDAKTAGNEKAIKAAITTRNQMEGKLKELQADLNEDQKEVLKVYDSIAKNTNWNDVF